MGSGGDESVITFCFIAYYYYIYLVLFYFMCFFLRCINFRKRLSVSDACGIMNRRSDTHRSV